VGDVEMLGKVGFYETFPLGRCWALRIASCGMPLLGAGEGMLGVGFPVTRAAPLLSSSSFSRQG